MASGRSQPIGGLRSGNPEALQVSERCRSIRTPDGPHHGPHHGPNDGPKLKFCESPLTGSAGQGLASGPLTTPDKHHTKFVSQTPRSPRGSNSLRTKNVREYASGRWPVPMYPVRSPNIQLGDRRGYRISPIFRARCGIYIGTGLGTARRAGRPAPAPAWLLPACPSLYLLLFFFF